MIAHCQATADNEKEDDNMQAGIITSTSAWPSFGQLTPNLGEEVIED